MAKEWCRFASAGSRSLLLLLAVASACSGRDNLGFTGGGGATGAGGNPGAAGYWTGPQSKTRKLDLLLVVENSLSMGDAQTFFREAASDLVTRLVTPHCVDASGLTQPAPEAGACPDGTTLEIAPVESLHVGVVTSSMGAAGKGCPNIEGTPHEDDRGHLVGPDNDMNSTDAVIAFDRGSSDPAALKEAVSLRLGLVGEQGCGYGAPHEAWYRFLVDPAPPASLAFDQSTQMTIATGLDELVLAQRASFLRPDSAVAIVVLSKANDCSIIDYGQGWMVAADTRLPRSTSACAVDPNDRCCFSCKLDVELVPAGCPGPVGSPSPDSECTLDSGEGWGAGFLSAVEDCACLRCWQTKRRFGVDLLFPVQRYVDGLTKNMIASRELDSSGQPLPQANPLFSGGRDPSLVTLVGIVGVPWQDLATGSTLDGALHALEFRDYASLAQAGRWDVALGHPEASPPVQAGDPFMVESVDERSGQNPVTGQPIVPSSSTDRHATINGHEVNVGAASRRDHLQYACIFDLPTAMQRDCSEDIYNSMDPTIRKGCDCRPDPGGDPLGDIHARNRPICVDTWQVAAKACPGTRHLEILRGLGPRGVVASVCPKFSADADMTEPSYGYDAVVDATLTRLRGLIE